MTINRAAAWTPEMIDRYDAMMDNLDADKILARATQADIEKAHLNVDINATIKDLQDGKISVAYAFGAMISYMERYDSAPYGLSTAVEWNLRTLGRLISRKSVHCAI